MQDHIDRILIDQAAIATRVKELAGDITRDLLEKSRQENQHTPASQSGGHPPSDLPPTELEKPIEITIIPILTGSFIFAADLIRHLPLMLQIRLLSISSYPGTATTSRGTMLKTELTNLPQSLEGSHVLLVDDILDTGRTLKLAVDLLAQRNPASIHTCVLLHKQLRDRPMNNLGEPDADAFKADYIAFDIPDEFVVGYGLDFNDYYRNLPNIVTLKPHVIEQAVQEEQTNT
jgi:hypoxanthine phosphoribosyltransferase